MTEVFEAEVKSITTEKVQRLYLDVSDADFMKEKRILIVDDVISTGESLRAIEHLCGKSRRKDLRKNGYSCRGRRNGKRGYYLS